MASTIAATSNPTTTWNSQRHANRVQDQLRQLRLALEKTRDVVAHVWPLRDAVAVNPFEGLGHQQLLTTHRWLRGLSDIELLGTVEHFRKAFQAGEFTVDDVASAIAELVQDDIEEALRIDLRATMRVVSDDTSICPLGSPNPNRRIRTMVESIDRFDGTSWAQRVSAEISKHLADYFDDVQASWKSGAARAGLYDYWKATGAVDRELEVAGVGGGVLVGAHVGKRVGNFVGALLGFGVGDVVGTRCRRHPTFDGAGRRNSHRIGGDAGRTSLEIL